MGGSSSKSAPTIGTPLQPAFNVPDYSEATFSKASWDKLSMEKNLALSTAQQQTAAALAAAAKASSDAYWRVAKWGGGIVGGLLILTGIILACIAAYDAIACQFNGHQILFNIPGKCNTPPAPPALPQATAPPGATGSRGLGSTQQVSSVTSPRPILWNWIYGSASGNLIPTMFDSTTPTSIASSMAPLPTEGSGAYGIQWWMFVKDWNYGYGKEKIVLSRPDPSNVAIMNPKVTLAPTENNLRVSVSVFPSEEGGASKTEPAPANDHSASDDVFVCEVPNIPLQSWFSVSMTVFDRNLDIYINGNLVKSCFLPGVPKPAAGNIDVSKDGGFSGYMCNLNHYAKMLAPSDAQSFYSAGTSCSNQSGSSGPSGGYSVKFGVYDVKGKEVKEYTF